MTYVISFHKIYFLIKGLMNMLDILLHGIAPLVPTSPTTIEENSCHICQDVRNHANDRLHSLTKREKQVLQLIVTGNSNKVTAFLLKIVQRSVENHRANIMRKTGAKSQCELICLYIASVNKGLITDLVNQR